MPHEAKNIAIEAGRGDESLDSARILLAAGKYADSVSRAYYGAFHYARCIVISFVKGSWIPILSDFIHVYSSIVRTRIAAPR